MAGVDVSAPSSSSSSSSKGSPPPLPQFLPLQQLELHHRLVKYAAPMSDTAAQPLLWTVTENQCPTISCTTESILFSGVGVGIRTLALTGYAPVTLRKRFYWNPILCKFTYPYEYDLSRGREQFPKVSVGRREIFLPSWGFSFLLSLTRHKEGPVWFSGRETFTQNVCVSC